MQKHIYFTPGPSQLFHRFQDHFRSALSHDFASISHRSKASIKLIEETCEALRTLMRIPKDYHLFFLNSANEAWDRIIQNLIDSHSHHFVNGAFSKKFYDFAIMYRMQSTCGRVEDGKSFTDLHVPQTAELICVTANETSVGYSFTDEELAQIRRENPDKLIALDVVSASPAVCIDFEQVDTAYLSVQKAFGMPAGLGVWIANERCIEKSIAIHQKRSSGSYRSLANLKKFAGKFQTPETPNLVYIYILGEIAKDLIRYGVEKMQNDIIYKGTLINQTIDNHPSLTHFVASEKHQSKTTAVALTPHAQQFIERCQEKGFIIGNGYGPHKDKHIRIANFPAHSKEAVESLCDLLMKID